MDDFRLDPLIGLVFPFFGDVVCGFLSLLIVGAAWQQKAPRTTIARMLVNIAIDTGLGAIPVLGDYFDFLFRANSRNLRLLERAQSSHGAYWRDGLVLAGAALLCVCALCLPLVAGFWVLATLIHWGGT